MTILIFISKQHIYGNFILSSLIKMKCFSKHKVFVFEQDGIVPGKTKLQGLWKYIKISGMNYVMLQIVKQWVFTIRQLIDIIFGNKMSLYYPYNRLIDGTWKICLENDLQNNDIYSRIQQLHPDLILSIYSKEIIPKRILSIPKFGSINLHPAFLPNYRGVSPVFWALVNKEKTVGSTLHYLDVGIDTGRIIKQRKIYTGNIFSEHSLYLKVSSAGVGLIRELLVSLSVNKKKLISKSMNVKKGNYYSLPTKEAVTKFKENGYKFFHLSEFIV